ncbi:MAG: thiosulfate oxidation carrier complex protein SoxZ [Calditrichaeota bacterium]|nr:MAG: thiosulfate oxidation carrier complex protein SoxZ [Calditrichota bacterium]
MGIKIGKSKIKLPRSIHPNDLVEVKCIIIHPMETGRRKNRRTGERIPAHYIEDVEVYYGEDKIAHFEIGAGVSQNPLFSFYLKATKQAPLKMIFRDNQGGTYQSTASIAFG